MRTMEQKVEEYPKFATELKNPEFADYAISCGGVGYNVKEPYFFLSPAVHLS